MYTPLLSTPPPASRKLLPVRSLAPPIHGQLSCTCLGMAHSGFSNVLKNGGFQAFLWTQFLGAFNDSVYQTIVALHVGNANRAYVPLVPAGLTLASLLHDKPLWLAVLGVSYFWFAGVLLKTDLQYFGRDVLGAGDSGVSLLWAFLAIGIGVGNMLAGRLSGDKLELGLVPMGAAFMGFFALALVAARHSFAFSTAAVVGLAMASGLFVVPLYAYIQQRSDSREKGRVVAANNFYQTIGMLIASAVMWLAYPRLHLGAVTIMLGFGVSMLLVTAYIVTVVPDYLVRFVLWLLTHSFFRIRINGQENVPFQ